MTTNTQNFNEANFPLSGPGAQQSLPDVPRSYLTMGSDPPADSPFRDPSKAVEHFKPLFEKIQTGDSLTTSHIQRILALVHFGGLDKPLADKLNITLRVVRIISASSPVNNRHINTESLSQLKHQIKTLQTEVKALHDETLRLTQENKTLREQLASTTPDDESSADTASPPDDKKTASKYRESRATSDKKTQKNDKTT